MRRRILSLLLATLFSHVLFAQSGVERPINANGSTSTDSLTLSQACGRAEQANPGLLSAQAALSAVQGQVIETGSAPSFDSS